MHNVTVPDRPWIQAGIDICSLPKSEDDFVGIVIAIDYFTKWVKAEPIRDKTAESVSNFIYQLICRHGCLEIQINDQGRKFVNKVSTQLHTLTGTKQRITSAYHPQVISLF